MQLLGTFTPIATYDFNVTLDILARYTHPTLDRVRDDAYWRVLHVDEALALVCVKVHANDDLGVYLVDAKGTLDTQKLMLKMRHMLAIDENPSGFYDYARHHPLLWKVVEPLVGVRLFRTASVFEALAITTTEQQISWVAAQKAQRYLIEWGCHFIEHDGERYYAFPTPSQFAVATLADLKPTKITFRRMNILVNVAGQVMAGALDLERLLTISPEEAYKALVSIKGIGHWTAAWTLSRTLGQHNFVGYNDVALQAAVNQYFYGKEGKIPEAQVTETFAQFGDYAGRAAHYTLMRLVLDRYEKR